jgi:hypothetical protein
VPTRSVKDESILTQNLRRGSMKFYRKCKECTVAQWRENLENTHV